MHAREGARAAQISTTGRCGASTRRERVPRRLSVRAVNTQARLGLEVDEAEADTLFDSWDLDSSGSLSIEELHKILRRGGKVRPAG